MEMTNNNPRQIRVQEYSNKIKNKKKKTMHNWNSETAAP